MDTVEANQARMFQEMRENYATLLRAVQVCQHQNYQLHENFVPRIFVVKPVEESGWNILSIMRSKFRLYFLCECGDFIQNPDAPRGLTNEMHIAMHEGYEIREPTKFFKAYGSYMLAFLQILSTAITVAGGAAGALVPLVGAGNDSHREYSGGVTDLVSLIDWNLSALKTFQEIPGVNDSSVRGAPSHITVQGADLRQLRSYLRIADKDDVLGNLVRSVQTDTGNIQWICQQHYNAKYNAEQEIHFYNYVESNRIKYDRDNGRCEVHLVSRKLARNFYQAMKHALCLNVLRVTLDWELSGTDIKMLNTAIVTSNIKVLVLDCCDFVKSSMKNVYDVRYTELSELLKNIKLKEIHLHRVGQFLSKAEIPAKPTHLTTFGIAGNLRLIPGNINKVISFMNYCEKTYMFGYSSDDRNPFNFESPTPHLNIRNVMDSVAREDRQVRKLHIQGKTPLDETTVNTIILLARRVALTDVNCCFPLSAASGALSLLKLTKEPQSKVDRKWCDFIKAVLRYPNVLRTLQLRTTICQETIKELVASTAQENALNDIFLSVKNLIAAADDLETILPRLKVQKLGFEIAHIRTSISSIVCQLGLNFLLAETWLKILNSINFQTIQEFRLEFQDAHDQASFEDMCQTLVPKTAKEHPFARFREGVQNQGNSLHSRLFEQFARSRDCPKGVILFIRQNIDQDSQLANSRALRNQWWRIWHDNRLQI